jgi:hypothetical protein
MKRLRLSQRVRQFWHTLFSIPTPEGVEIAQKVLTPRQFELFQTLPRADQAHALRVLWTLQHRREDHRDLLVAALLHDVGKARYPLRLWERVCIVLADGFFPERAERWGQGEPRGWRRPFVVAKNHPSWSAEMAAMSGATPLAVSLIWRHQDTLSVIPDSTEDRLLRALQAADNDS